MVRFLSENLKIPLSASIAFDQSNAERAKVAGQLRPSPYNDRKSKSKRKNPSILALLVFIDELMLAHHELASP